MKNLLLIVNNDEYNIQFFMGQIEEEELNLVFASDNDEVEAHYDKIQDILSKWTGKHLTVEAQKAHDEEDWGNYESEQIEYESKLKEAEKNATLTELGRSPDLDTCPAQLHIRKWYV